MPKAEKVQLNVPKAEKVQLNVPKAEKVCTRKACGVVVRASASRLGDPGSNLGSAKFFIMDWLSQGPHKYFIRAPVSKLGGETSSRIRA